MLVLLSPAKKLDYDSPIRTNLSSQPLFIDHAQGLIDILKPLSAQALGKLMSLSENLSQLNRERYQAWEPHFNPQNSRPALLAFNGDVYTELDAASLSDEQLLWAQEHIAILSGLYGVLRPLDLMQAYRLEMGTRLENPRGRNLYEWWGSLIAEHLNTQLEVLKKQGEEALVLNLASEEYVKAVDRDTLNAPMVQCVFQDYSRDVWKVISFNAKRARGLMARFVIDQRITTVDALRDFEGGGYRFTSSESTEDRLVFRRSPNAD